MTLPTDLDSTYPDTGHPSVPVHQQHHDLIHAAVNLLEEQTVASRVPSSPEILTKWAHVQRDHGQIQAAISSVTGTADGTYDTTEQNMLNALVTAVNAILVALRAQGAIRP